MSTLKERISELSAIARPAFLGVAVGIPLVLGTVNFIAYDLNMSSCRRGRSVEELMERDLEGRKYDLIDGISILAGIGEKASYYACQDLQEQNKSK